MEILSANQGASCTPGRLKIFMGYAPGVGKTYAMLEAARQKKSTGWDICAVAIETHGQADNEAFLDEFKIIPPKSTSFAGTSFSDIDVEETLKQRPQLILVDDLSHHNAPGARHPRRYQDVLEILANGIDVYATLNIHHIESLNDLVHQITSLRIEETVPDRILDEADEIEIIDLSPEELLKRYKDGRVQLPDKYMPMASQYFRRGNLIALREICLLRVAERVDAQMRQYMETRKIKEPWGVRERLLVCIDEQPFSKQLIRSGWRFAAALGAEWHVLHVRAKKNKGEWQNVEKLLHAAEEMGAQIAILTSQDISRTILDYARKHHITKIVMGNSRRSFFKSFFKLSPTLSVLQNSGMMDVLVITNPVRMPQSRAGAGIERQHTLLQYISGVLLVGLTTLLGYSLHGFLEATNLVMFYLAAVLIASLYLGRGPSILVSFLSLLAFDFFFITPKLSFTVYDTQYLLTFVGLLVVSLVVSGLTGTIREQVVSLQQREAQASTLYALSRELTNSMNLEKVLNTVVGHINLIFGGEAVILLPKDSSLEMASSGANFKLDENSSKVALWAYRHNSIAGRGTENLPDTPIRFQPLRTAQGVVGVLGLRLDNTPASLSPDQKQLLDAYASLAAVAIESARLAEQASQMHIIHETEKLESALLNSISHDLRTPLAAITGALSSLYEAEAGNDIDLPPSSRKELLETGLEEAQRLNQLVGNLLQMTRLEAGALKLKKEKSSVEELVGSALSTMRTRLVEYKIQTNIPDRFPLVPMDFVLMQQVLINLLDNAVKYAQPGTVITLSAEITSFPSENDQLQWHNKSSTIGQSLQQNELGQAVCVTVQDQGIGIQAEDLPRLFDKFYRAEHPGRISGTGLGLSICKGIIEAHGGMIFAANNPQGGAQFSFYLPIEETGTDENEEEQ